MVADRLALPPDARALSLLSRIDYSDCFLLGGAWDSDDTGEAWARSILEEAPRKTRTDLERGWRILGVRLGSLDNERFVLGWTLRRSAPEHALLTATSATGIQAEVLVKRHGDGLLLATQMKFGNPLIRLLWVGIAIQHRRVVRHLLEQAVRRSQVKQELQGKDSVAV